MLGAQPVSNVTVVIQGAAQVFTVDVHPANRVAPMSAVFKAELPDYFDVSACPGEARRRAHRLALAHGLTPGRQRTTNRRCGASFRARSTARCSAR